MLSVSICYRSFSFLAILTADLKPSHPELPSRAAHPENGQPDNNRNNSNCSSKWSREEAQETDKSILIGLTATQGNVDQHKWKTHFQILKSCWLTLLLPSIHGMTRWKILKTGGQKSMEGWDRGTTGVFHTSLGKQVNSVEEFFLLLFYLSRTFNYQ